MYDASNAYGVERRSALPDCSRAWLTSRHSGEQRRGLGETADRNKLDSSRPDSTVNVDCGYNFHSGIGNDEHNDYNDNGGALRYATPRSHRRQKQPRPSCPFACYPGLEPVRTTRNLKTTERKLGRHDGKPPARHAARGNNNS